MAWSVAKVTSRSHRIQTTLSWEAGLEVELELHQIRDLIQHSQYNPAFILLVIKSLVVSPHYSSILFP
jgi:hypothetical protein